MKLYVVLDRELLIGKDLVETAKALIDAGVDIIQYRDKISTKEEILKNATELRKLDFPLIINDYPFIAREVDALGVHLGQQDMDIKSARKIVGNKAIGKSTHNLNEALQAQMEGADYIGIGPVFPTNTKKGVAPIGLDVLRKVAEYIDIPAFAIGGITLENIDSVLETGIERVAIASAILCSEDIKKAVKEFKDVGAYIKG